jgi:integrase
MIYWGKTKNGLPHSIPVPPQAADILTRLVPNKHGLYFPNKLDSARPMISDSILWAVQHFRLEHPEIPHFVPKDARRTWKTLAGDAGVSKEMRDRLQNHVKKSDVSTRHYDRYDYLSERRAAMSVWSAYLGLVIAGEIKEIGQRESNVVPIGKGAA